MAVSAGSSEIGYVGPNAASTASDVDQGDAKRAIPRIEKAMRRKALSHLEHSVCTAHDAIFTDESKGRVATVKARLRGVFEKQVVSRDDL
jgi:hypothetical protein